MRSARFFLACAVVSVLAACGTDPVAPAAPEHAAPVVPRVENATLLQCAGTWVTRTLPDGTVTTECVLDGRQTGSGG